MQKGVRAAVFLQPVCTLKRWSPNRRNTRQSFSRPSNLTKTARIGRIREIKSAMDDLPEIEKEETEAQTPSLQPGSLVLVVGATGGVGQLAVGRLLDLGYRVRAVTRDLSKAESLLGSKPNLELVKCDFKNAEEIPPIMKDVDAVLSSLGTTAFPSSRWRGDNNPEMTDGVAYSNLIEGTPKTVKRFIMVSSAGVDRPDELPFSIMNVYKVLTYRKAAEDKLKKSGLAWTILRPSRLTDAPYTSFDLNTLIKGTRGNRTAVKMSRKDEFAGETSRLAVAEAMSVDGDNPPEQDDTKWSSLFESVDS